MPVVSMVYPLSVKAKIQCPIEGAIIWLKKKKIKFLPPEIFKVLNHSCMYHKIQSLTGNSFKCVGTGLFAGEHI